MAPLSLKIILGEGAVTRTLMFDTKTTVKEAHVIMKDKILALEPNREYGFFLPSADNEYSGVWLEDGGKTLEYYMLREGDSLHYLPKIRNMRLRMLDGAVKTLQLDESKKVGDLMVYICEKLRISNSEEYGLCREEKESLDDPKVNAMGTLTLRKKTVQREKDAKLEQLSKKLKTDDLVEWLDQHKTLRELQVDPHETLLFKRKLFYSDRNVDSRDPVQLNLLYVQTRDGILEGKQVVTESKALEFAGLQCHIQYGDYDEDKHKPGFIQNLKEFLPEQYVTWGAEKKVIREHKTHIGLPEIEAKQMYTRMARELPTYGVTFFLVKEKQLKKKKLVPRLLGINANSILRLDEETKEIIQVWLLTQVKSYRADYESFALNFGDYSEKEYVVKTNEGYRIKDILEGYIDIIKRSLAGPRKVNFIEGEAIFEDNVEMSRGTTFVNYAAKKAVEHSLVGPSQIISVEQGQQFKEGTQIVTVNELMKTNIGSKSQQPITTHGAKVEPPKHHISNGIENKMKTFNSKCVTSVVYLSDPTELNIKEARKVVAFMEAALPELKEGVNETAANSSPLKAKMLLNNLNDLCSYLDSLSSEAKNNDLTNEENLTKALDAANKLADLSTQMHLSLDPNTKRRSKILMRSRHSFIQDEKTEASLRRASFLTATDNAWTTVENAAHYLDEPNESPLSSEECQYLALKSEKHLGKLQATIAMILNSHADPSNIDYESAVMSMKTLSELIPSFVQDVKALTNDENKVNGKDLKEYVKQLLDCTRAMCMLTGSDNVNKMYDVGNDYADVSTKITEILKSPDTFDKNEEFIKLVQNVGNKVQLLLMGTSELTKLEASDPRATELDAAAIKCTDATEGLLACARLTSSSIREPHSQSALTAATENLASSAQRMALLWKPLSEKPDRKSFAKQLANGTFELAKALDKLKNAFTNIPVPDQEPEMKRLKFIATARSADKVMSNSNIELQKLSDLPVAMMPKNVKNDHPGLQNNLSQKLAHLNAAVAALLQATGNPNNADYDNAETAVDIISKLTPDIIQDSRSLNGQVDEATWKKITEYLKEMLEATRDMCSNAEEINEDARNKAASKFAKASGQLTYIYNPNKKYEQEDQILDLAKSAVDQISQMLTQVYDLVEKVDRSDGDLLDNAGVKVVGPAQRMLKVAEVSGEIKNLTNTWKPILQSPSYNISRNQLDNSLKTIENSLNLLRNACTASDDVEEMGERKCIASISAAEDALNGAYEELQQITVPQEGKRLTRNNDPELRAKLSQSLGRLNAAIADLLQSTSVPNRFDYDKAENAMQFIKKSVPNIIKDSKELNGQVDENSWNNIKENLKELLEATQDICANADETNNDTLNDAATRFAKASGHLTYIYNPRKRFTKEDQILDLAKSAVDQISQMLTQVYDLVEKVDRSDGDLLDNAGVKVVGPAQRMLKVAEITAPNIHEPKCQTSLLCAIDQVSGEIKNLTNTWKPILQSPSYNISRNQLDNSLKTIENSLNLLRNACTASDDVEEMGERKCIASISAAEDALNGAYEELQQITVPQVPKGEIRYESPKLQNDLSKKLSNLNAAIAALLQATTGSNNPRYEEVEAAMDVIRELAPAIVKDSKQLQGQLDEQTWKNISDNLVDMLEATKDVCTNTKESNDKDLYRAASKLANSSNKLRFIFNPRKNSQEEKVRDLAKSILDESSRMLPKMSKLADDVGGEHRSRLYKLGNELADSMQRLHKIVELTVPSLRNSQSQDLLVSSINEMSNREKQFLDSWEPFLLEPNCIQNKKELEDSMKIIDTNKLKLAKYINEFLHDHPQNKESCKLNETLEEAKKNLAKSKKELKHIMSVNPTKSKIKHATSTESLAQRLAQLNAALASLLNDCRDSDSSRKIQAINNFSDRLSDVIKDVKLINGSVDPHTWSVILDNLKQIIDGSEVIYDSLEDPEEVDSASGVVMNSLATLNSVCNQHANTRKESQVTEYIQNLSRTAVEQISLLLPHVYNLVKCVGGIEGTNLDQRGVVVVDRAKQFLKTAQITASTIDNPDCKEVLMSSVDHLKQLLQNLKETWEPLVHTQNNNDIKHQLNQNFDVVNGTLNKIKTTCLDDPENLDIQEKLEKIKICEVKEILKDAEKLLSEEKVALEVDRNEKPLLDQRKMLSEKITLLNEAVARLILAMLDRKNPEFKTIEESLTNISYLSPAIIKDIMCLQNKLDDDSRQTMFEEAKSLCKTNQSVCSSIENNNLEELLQEASKYAQSSAKLIHITNPHSHPNKERKILDLSRNACERTSLMLSRLSRLAGASQGTENLEDKGQKFEAAGITVANAAHALLTNAQITAPSINEKNCKAVLLSSTERLSDLAQDIKGLWQPLRQNTESKEIIAQLQRDLNLLDKDLLDLKDTCQDNLDHDYINLHYQNNVPLTKELQLESQSNVGNFQGCIPNDSKIDSSEKGTNEPLVVVNTPLRQLALKILESTKMKLKSDKLKQPEHKDLERFSENLSAALNTLDLCYAKCVNKPLDSKKYQDLELAIMDLQQICLLSRRGNSSNNIVDLTDYVNNVISAANIVLEVADNLHLTSEKGNESLKILKEHCNRIQENERVLQNSESLETQGGIIDNMTLVDQFAKDCDEQIQEMAKIIPNIESESARNILKEKVDNLTECCDLLKFAAKSSISSAASVEFEDNIQNLESVASNIENILEINEGLQKSDNPSKQDVQVAQTKLTAAILSGNECHLPKELTRYAVAIQSNEGDNRRLKEHLQKLLDLLKLQTITRSHRIATWQDVDSNNTIREKILEELESYLRDIKSPHTEGNVSEASLISNNDIRRLLISNTPPAEGDIEGLKHKLNKQVDKMASITETIMQSFQKPEMLSKSLHKALETTENITSLSKALKGKDLLQSKKIDEASQEVNMATYDVIKTSESLCQSPVPGSKRKLLEACKNLNDALNKLARVSCADSDVCIELQRDLKLVTQLVQHETAPLSASLTDCADQLHSQLEVMNVLRSSDDMAKNYRNQLRHVTSAVCNSAEFGTQSAFLLSLSDEDKNVAQLGVVDDYKISKSSEAIQETCLQIICSRNPEQAKELGNGLNKQINQLQELVDDTTAKVNDEYRNEIVKNNEGIHESFKKLQDTLNSTNFKEKEITSHSFKLMDAIRKLNSQIERIPRPKIDESFKKKEISREVKENVRKLINNASTMVKKASCSVEDNITWANIGGNDVIQALEALISCIKKRGVEAGLIEPEEQDIPSKSYVQTQVDLANTWLRKPASKDDKVAGVEAAESLLELADKMCEDLSGGEKEELKHLIIDTKQLLKECSNNYNSDKASQLRERLQDIRKLCERGAVTRVVETFLMEPQHDLDQVTQEPDENKRKFLLERKIAELLTHLASVSKTARFVADTGLAPRQILMNTTDQAELLAPALVKAAEKRIQHPNDEAAIAHYQELLANYAESLTKIRELCDRSVDPIDFSRAAGETMHRITEENSKDPQRSVYTSTVIRKLGKRVVEAGMQASLVKKDVELQRTLANIKESLDRAALEHHTNWKQVATEVLKKTGEVESVLGGENIFQKEPESDQPIYTAALQLHAAVRGWSARQNDVVDGAKLLAVLMARLSHYMDTDNTKELIATSKSIVERSREIVIIARKLALECTDMRIRTNLLQVCERIPTISGQLKMLTTVKGASLGQQGTAEDKEAMNMLVGNAQNLMISIQEVVSAAESASVKIMSTQRGFRMKWVQRNYY
nr:talin-1-like [Danaus plexippus plexippus]